MMSVQALQKITTLVAVLYSAVLFLVGRARKYDREQVSTERNQCCSVSSRQVASEIWGPATYISPATRRQPSLSRRWNSQQPTLTPPTHPETSPGTPDTLLPVYSRATPRSRTQLFYPPSLTLHTLRWANSNVRCGGRPSRAPRTQPRLTTTMAPRPAHMPQGTKPSSVSSRTVSHRTYTTRPSLSVLVLLHLFAPVVVGRVATHVITPLATPHHPNP
jgi:hypothetical protein